MNADLKDADLGCYVLSPHGLFAFCSDVPPEPATAAGLGKTVRSGGPVKVVQIAGCDRGPVNPD